MYQKRWKEDETRRVHWLSSTNCTVVEWDRSARSRRPGGTPHSHLRLPSCQLATPTGSIHPLAVVRERERDATVSCAAQTPRGPRAVPPSQQTSNDGGARQAGNWATSECSTHTAAPATHRPRPDPSPRSGTGRRHASATVLRAAPRYATCCTPPARPRCVPACRFAGPIDRSVRPVTC